MARPFDFYHTENVSNPDWEEVVFPDTDSATIPNETGVYRFVCHHDADKQTLFIDDTCTSRYGDTVRSCYFHHSSVSGDKGDELADLYSIQGILFEHYVCGSAEAKRQRHMIMTRFKPHYNVILLEITDNPNDNPFR